ncbi:MAG: cation:proton antiporter [Bacteriovoracaceae bacterium]|nr:cation:proton antiporter [Bacteriovoracaceae bacterium]
MKVEFLESAEYQYLLLFSFILFVPRLLLRFRIPVGISALTLGFICTYFLGWFDSDQLVLLFSRLGITSLFLFAGMEIELEELKKNAGSIIKYLLKSLVIILAVAYGVKYFLDIGLRPSLIVAIGLMTPSTGFILNSLKSYELTDEEVYWIRLKAISKEILAILVLFFALKSNDISSFLISKSLLIGLIILLPLLFSFFLKVIAPFAPKSEVSFLVLVALIAGIITKKIGTYYLVGAFIAGVTAGQFKHFIKSDESERILNSLATFFSIFVPFYFFKAGLSITKDLFTQEGLILGLIFIGVFIPLRVVSVLISVKFFVKNFWHNKFKISLSLIPTLIFGLVILSILKENFDIDKRILSGLLLYTIVSSIIPSIAFKKAPPEVFDLSRV